MLLMALLIISLIEKKSISLKDDLHNLSLFIFASYDIICDVLHYVNQSLYKVKKQLATNRL